MDYGLVALPVYDEETRGLSGGSRVDWGVRLYLARYASFGLLHQRPRHHSVGLLVNIQKTCVQTGSE